MRELIKKIWKRKVVVLGDMMLDSYQWGKVDRISPEAPVPVIAIDKEEYRLGGAANVALNLTALGAEVYPIGVVGSEGNAKIMRKLFKHHKLDTEGLVSEKGRKTTIKTRIGAVNQQIVRIDIEDNSWILAETENEIISKLAPRIKIADLLIIEDYNKGLLSERVIAETLRLCEEHKVPVAVDPKQKNFFSYQAVDIFKPNYLELQNNLGVTFDSEKDFMDAASKSLDLLKCKYLVVTHGAKGMYIFSKGSKVRHLPSFAREVYDVSGAGDTVISALALAYSAGAEIAQAASFANHAAAVVCGKLGTATASSQEILASYETHR
ncbi:MAG: D-glycero-beta-D-manno-heptose-7-phosphate kinase [Candidatus Cloacimonadaceae bacterium]|jgi:rfaE bifunctional protein kinase chain/domain|nr:D-glycero-beta-D-manno-heptose-7-phosphate kinase [Candidatus Cloacimonadota bacterium]MDY0127563.1 D-glycero-beta-D-manno-heptose-7-phosphate kinase [Candidatus Cloacimonadaceae bacterium]MCB5254594.1 D-glycero-beta-D-manno-heptose-7-phosphate kinase [Candidatus Cloacimonadota bacterium]MCK9178245.1 D-glycero-beta-D-manno-heptose-7-phosphate kinase [Candidatus Cloacimonadota bacterium]MCK9242529.1 D-glycero-beta-D-manno-heptose-7-phosphate kinase [Candidatus Cloacimonadota bacterium]